MPRKKNPTPSYLRHKPRNCGKVRIDGKDIYLPGEYDSPESREAYHRLVAEYLATGRLGDSKPDEPTINELIWQFWERVVTKRYVKRGVCSMRTCDIHQHHARIPKEVAGLCWIYIPDSHKTEDHGKDRTVLLGPQAQEILEPWLRPDAPEAFLFSPAEARAWFDARRRANRKTPMTPSQRKRTRKANPKRAPGDCYPEHAYATAIGKACRRAGVPHWFPLQLRHNGATRLRADGYAGRGVDRREDGGVACCPSPA
jgi:hypothetical protein